MSDWRLLPVTWGIWPTLRRDSGVFSGGGRRGTKPSSKRCYLCRHQRGGKTETQGKKQWKCGEFWAAKWRR